MFYVKQEYRARPLREISNSDHSRLALWQVLFGAGKDTAILAAMSGAGGDTIIASCDPFVGRPAGVCEYRKTATLSKGRHEAFTVVNVLAEFPHEVIELLGADAHLHDFLAAPPADVINDLQLTGSVAHAVARELLVPPYSRMGTLLAFLLFAKKTAAHQMLDALRSQLAPVISNGVMVAVEQHNATAPPHVTATVDLPFRVLTSFERAGWGDGD